MIHLLYGLAQAASLTGLVTDEDGVPAPGVNVIAYDQRLNYAYATTTNDGTWGITNLPAGRYRLRAAPADDSGLVDRFYPDTWDFCTADVVAVEEDSEVAALDFVLARGGTFTGVLRTGEGTAVVGALVAAEGLEARTALGTRVTYTDAEGRFVLSGLDADPDLPTTWRCEVQIDGWPRQFLGPGYDDEDAEVFAADLGVEEDLGAFTLLDGISVAGTVRGPDGPVSGGTIYAYASSQVVVTSIESDGTYLARGLPPGNVITWASSAGYATTYYPDADRPGESVTASEEGTDLEGVDLSLPEEATFTAHVSVSDGSGARWRDASVLLYNSTYTVGRGEPFDSDGNVTIDALFPGEYTLYLYGQDGGLVSDFIRDGAEPRVFTVDGDTEVDIVLDPANRLSGTVRDELGEPVYGAQISVWRAEDDTDLSATTDHDGAWVIDGVGVGTWSLSARYLYYCPRDPGYVAVWWEDALTEADEAKLALGEGELREGLDLVMPRDADHDAMGDSWERENGLDDTRDDGAEDPDGDGFTNLDEYLLGTDPTSADGGGPGGCACGGKGEAGAAGLLLLGLAGLARRRR